MVAKQKVSSFTVKKLPVMQGEDSAAAWQVGKQYVTLYENNRIDCSCEAACNTTPSWCPHISEIIAKEHDAPYIKKSEHLLVPIRPSAANASLRFIKMNLVSLFEDDDSDGSSLRILAMWTDLLAAHLPYQMTYQQLRNAGSMTAQVMIGVRLPGEGRMAMRNTFLRFVRYVDQSTTIECKGRRHKTHSKSREVTGLEDVLSILRTALCVKCEEQLSKPYAKKEKPESFDDDLVPDI